MNNINFTIDGLLGDFIHSLYALKNICEKNNTKANLFVKDGQWIFSIEKSYNDLYSLVSKQPYIDKFEILKHVPDIDVINLSEWRNRWINVNNENGCHFQCWSEILSDQYKFDIPTEYKWLTTEINSEIKDKIVIHRSVHRHNTSFNWTEILKKTNEDILFLTTDNKREWEEFGFKNDRITPYYVSNIEEMATVIASCKMFIGNQSAPFALACALDVPRLVELDSHPAKFYMDENKYSNNISWFLNNDTKYRSTNCMFYF